MWMNLSIDPTMNYRPPGSSVHSILQARILEWVAITFSRGSSQARDWAQSPALLAYSLPGKTWKRSECTKLRVLPPAVFNLSQHLFFFYIIFACFFISSCLETIFRRRFLWKYYLCIPLSCLQFKYFLDHTLFPLKMLQAWF